MPGPCNSNWHSWWMVYVQTAAHRLLLLIRSSNSVNSTAHASACTGTRAAQCISQQVQRLPTPQTGSRRVPVTPMTKDAWQGQRLVPLGPLAPLRPSRPFYQLPAAWKLCRCPSRLLFCLCCWLLVPGCAAPDRPPEMFSGMLPAVFKNDMYRWYVTLVFNARVP